MLPIKTVLYPTDFSKPSEYAFNMAAAIARDHGARMVIVHVEPPPIYFGEVIPPPPPDAGARIWEAFHKLEKTDPKVRELKIETRVVEGGEAAEIVNAAKETGADLIVMGTHGRTGVTRLLTGSVAEAVMRKAPCPVLTVKGKFTPAEVPAEVACCGTRRGPLGM